MEDGKNEIFDEVKMTESEHEQHSDSDRELLIFGEDDSKLGKEPGVKYTKPKVGYFIIAGLVGALIGIALTLFLVSRIVGGGLSKLTLIRDMGEYDCSVISELLQRIDATHFGETPSSRELVDKAAHALVDGMGDPYASYFTVKEYEDYTASFNGNYYGIGVLIQNPDGTGALIRRVYEGSFAEQAGLMKGDKIIAVGSTDVTNVTGNELVSLILGDEGTSVELTFLRDGKKMTATVMRGAVYVKRVDYFVLDNNIGYLYLSSFSGNAEEEFKAALEDFKARGIKKLIVDLRDNPGGSLYTVVHISDMLLPACNICSMQGKSTPDAEYFNSDESMYDFEFVVLVNEYSASASEIFAGAMQDNGRAKIIGVKTYGKGVVQTTYKLDSDHGWLKLTTDAYYTPNGTNLGGTGITPDIIVELPEGLRYTDVYTLYTEYLDQDTQLQAAISALLG